MVEGYTAPVVMPAALQAGAQGTQEGEAAEQAVLVTCLVINLAGEVEAAEAKEQREMQAQMPTG